MIPPVNPSAARKVLHNPYRASPPLSSSSQSSTTTSSQRAVTNAANASASLSGTNFINNVHSNGHSTLHLHQNFHAPEGVAVLGVPDDFYDQVPDDEPPSFAAAAPDSAVVPQVLPPQPAFVPNFSKPHSHGVDHNTIKGRESALVCFNDFQKEHNNLTFEELTEKDVENEHLGQILDAFGLYLSHEEIDQKNNTGKVLSGKTRAQYFGRVVQEARERWPHHPWFTLNSNETQLWISKWQANINKFVLKQSIASGLDSSNLSYRPLYPIVDYPSMVRFSKYFEGHGMEKWKDVRGIDMFSILDQLSHGKKGDGKSTNRLLICMNSQAIGRGGEPKFIRYDEMAWDDYLEILEANWNQVKTAHSSATSFAPHHSKWQMDIFDAFAAYFALDNGLMRSPNDKSIAKFVFPHLHSINQNSVTKKITAILQSCTDKRLAKFTTAKSPRRGYNTFLAAHPQISGEERRIRGGWKAQDMSDSESYKEILLNMTYPTALALNGWPDCHKWIKPMRINTAIGEEDLSHFPEFRNHLFSSNLEEISETKFPVLDMLMDTSLAACLMYYEERKKCLGVHADHMGEAMLVSLMKVTGWLPVVAGSKLTQWGRIIRDDFQTRNAVASGFENGSLRTSMEKQTDMLSNQATQTLIMRQELDDMRLECAQLRATSQELNAKLDHVVSILSSHMDGATTPSGKAVMNGAAVSLEKADNPAPPADRLEKTPKKRTVNALALLRFGGPEAEAAAGKKNKKAKKSQIIPASNVLMWMYEKGFFKSASQNRQGLEYYMHPEVTSANYASYRLAVRMLEDHMEQVAFDLLCDKTTSQERAKEICKHIVETSIQRYPFTKDSIIGMGQALKRHRIEDTTTFEKKTLGGATKETNE